MLFLLNEIIREKWESTKNYDERTRTENTRTKPKLEKREENRNGQSKIRNQRPSSIVTILPKDKQTPIDMRVPISQI